MTESRFGDFDREPMRHEFHHFHHHFFYRDGQDGRRFLDGRRGMMGDGRMAFEGAAEMVDAPTA